MKIKRIQGWIRNLIEDFKNGVDYKKRLRICRSRVTVSNNLLLCPTQTFNI
jgi:hypothetical protein